MSSELSVGRPDLCILGILSTGEIRLSFTLFLLLHRLIHRLVVIKYMSTLFLYLWYIIHRLNQVVIYLVCLMIDSDRLLVARCYMVVLSSQDHHLLIRAYIELKFVKFLQEQFQWSKQVTLQVSPNSEQQ